MATFTEDFNRSDVFGNTGDVVTLGVYNWTLEADSCGVYSNSFSKQDGLGAGTQNAGAALEVGQGDHVATVTVAAIDVGDFANGTCNFEIDVGANSADETLCFWSFFVRGDFNTNDFHFQVSVSLSDGSALFDLNTFGTSPLDTNLQVGDTLTLQVTGQGTATVVVVKHNAVTLGTYGQAEMTAAGMTAGQFDLLPDGTWDVIFVGANDSLLPSASNRIDSFSESVTAWPPGPVDHKLPALSSDVPYLQANDRYQVLACVNRGSSTTPPEFRYWYAGAPSWDESV